MDMLDIACGTALQDWKKAGFGNVIISSAVESAKGRKLVGCGI